MKRVLLALVALVVLLLPVLAVDGHAEGALAVSTGEQQVVITGHDAVEPDLHIERSSGTIEFHCPACLLDKRQTASKAGPGPLSKPLAGLSGRQFDPLVHGSSDLAAYRSPRAPPLT